MDVAERERKQTKNVRLFEEVLSAFNRRPEGSIAFYIHGLVEYGFYIFPNVF